MEEWPSSNVQSRQHMASTNFGAYGQRPPEVISKKSYREDKVPEVQKLTILSSQKRSDGAKNHSGPIKTERIYNKLNLQNAHLEASETPSPNGSLDGLTRPQGRLLAYRSCQSLQTIPGVQIQRPELEVPSDAVRTEPSTKNIFETDCIYSEMHDQERDLVPSIPRRLIDNCALERGMPSKAPGGHRGSTETRVDNKQRKVQAGTTTSLRMARSTLQLEEIRSEEYGYSDTTIQLTDESDVGEDVYQTHYHASPRTGKLARPSRPSTQNSPFTHQGVSKTPKESPPGRKITHEQQIEIIDLDMDEHPTHDSTPGDSRANMHNSSRCIPHRIWIQDRSEALPRQIRQIDEEILDQRARTPHDLDGNVDDPREEPSDHSIIRQLDGHCLNQQSLISSLPTSRSDKNDMDKSSTYEMDDKSGSYPRNVQCDSRPVVEEHSNIDRVVSPYEDIHSGDTTYRATSPSGLVCHKSQQQARDLHLSLSRPQSVCSGCSEDELERMGLHLPVSPSSACFEGFTQADTIKYQNRHIRHERGANKTLVCTTEVTSYSVTNNQHQTPTTSRRNHKERNTNFQNTRVEVLKTANNDQYPDCDEQTIHLMSVPVMKSSEEDYQRKWTFFLEFVAEKGIDFENINIDIVLRFFSYLFYTKGLKPTTISHYRTALTQPLLAYFKIDLKIPAVHSMLRAMKIQRPHQPTPRPAWSLNKVLTHLETLDTTPELNLLKKTAFLLLLATGWRISELHACVRNEDSFFTKASNATVIKGYYCL